MTGLFRDVRVKQTEGETYSTFCDKGNENLHKNKLL